MAELILALFGMLVGAAVTWWAAWHYYEKASRELAEQAEELRKLNVLMLRGLESAGMAEFSRDEEGNIKGMVIKGSGALIGAGAEISGVGLVTPRE